MSETLIFQIGSVISVAVGTTVFWYMLAWFRELDGGETVHAEGPLLAETAQTISDFGTALTAGPEATSIRSAPANGA